MAGHARNRILSGIRFGLPIRRACLKARGFWMRPRTMCPAEETIKIAGEYEFLVLFTSTPGFPGDIQLVQNIKEINPGIKVAFVGPHVTVLPEKSLRDCPAD